MRVIRNKLAYHVAWWVVPLALGFPLVRVFLHGAARDRFDSWLYRAVYVYGVTVNAD